jgi:heme A synthase
MIEFFHRHGTPFTVVLVLAAMVIVYFARGGS